MGLFRYALGDFGFIWGRRVHLGASLGRRVHPGSLGSFGCALAIVGFIPGHWGHWGAPWGSLGSFVVAVFFWGAPWGSSGSSWVVGLLGMRPGVSVVHPGRWDHWGAPVEFIRGCLRVRRQVHQRSLECALGFIEYICGRWVH